MSDLPGGTLGGKRFAPRTSSIAAAVLFWIPAALSRKLERLGHLAASVALCACCHTSQVGAEPQAAREPEAGRGRGRAGARALQPAFPSRPPSRRHTPDSAPITQAKTACPPRRTSRPASPARCSSVCGCGEVPRLYFNPERAGGAAWVGRSVSVRLPQWRSVQDRQRETGGLSGEVVPSASLRLRR